MIAVVKIFSADPQSFFYGLVAGINFKYNTAQANLIEHISIVDIE
jgi:hypothetical protein